MTRLVAVVLLVAVGSKFLDIVNGDGSDNNALIGAIAIPIEIAIIVALVRWPSARSTFLAVGTVFVTFILYGLAMAEPSACGCFGRIPVETHYLTVFNASIVGYCVFRLAPTNRVTLFVRLSGVVISGLAILMTVSGAGSTGKVAEGRSVGPELMTYLRDDLGEVSFSRVYVVSQHCDSCRSFMQMIPSGRGVVLAFIDESDELAAEFFPVGATSVALPAALARRVPCLPYEIYYRNGKVVHERCVFDGTEALSP